MSGSAADGVAESAAAASSREYVAPTSLRALLAAPKGTLEFLPGWAFMLHVFWLAPDEAAAATLLRGLTACSTATHRDTPCVPTYFFRVSGNDTDLAPPPPGTVGEHPHLRDAQRKLAMGVPPPAVRAGLVKLGIDPALAEAPADTELPEALRGSRAVALEFTEVYLDERAFIEHAGSRDYLDGHGVIMTPGLARGVPTTLRMGNAPPSLVEKVLAPSLRENVVPTLAPSGAVWRCGPIAAHGAPAAATDAAAAAAAAAVFVSVDVPGDAEAVSVLLPRELTASATTCAVFAHPLREGTARVMLVLPDSAERPAALAALARVPFVRGEAHTAHMAGSDEAHAAATAAVRAALDAAGLTGRISVDATASAGYVLHARAGEVREASS